MEEANAIWLAYLLGGILTLVKIWALLHAHVHPVMFE
jgi:hypothetical protein